MVVFNFLLIVSFYHFVIEKCNCTDTSGLTDTDMSNSVDMEAVFFCLKP